MLFNFPLIYLLFTSRGGLFIYFFIWEPHLKNQPQYCSYSEVFIIWNIIKIILLSATFPPEAAQVKFEINLS